MNEASVKQSVDITTNNDAVCWIVRSAVGSRMKMGSIENGVRPATGNRTLQSIAGCNRLPETLLIWPRFTQSPAFDPLGLCPRFPSINNSAVRLLHRKLEIVR